MNSSTSENLVLRTDESKTELVKVGAIAPNFLISSLEGQSFDLYNYIEGGCGMVVSFPKDDMIDLAALCAVASEIERRNTKIIALTPESDEEIAPKLQELIEKYSIPISFPIICDSDLKVLSQYGFVLEKKEKKRIQKGFFLVRGFKVQMTCIFPKYYKRDFKLVPTFIDSFREDMMEEDKRSSLTESQSSDLKSIVQNVTPIVENANPPEDHNLPRRQSIDQKNVLGNLGNSNRKFPKMNKLDKQKSILETSLNDISQALKIEPIHEKVKIINKDNLENLDNLELTQEDIELLKGGLQKIPLFKTKVEDEEVPAFEGKNGVDAVLHELKLPSRFHALNVMNYFFKTGYIVPLFPTKFGNKVFKSDKTLYTIVDDKEKKTECCQPNKELEKPASFASLIKLKVIQVQHLETKNAKFLSGKKYFWELMVGKDVLHTKSFEPETLLELNKEHVRATFPVFYTNQTLNISLVKKKFHQSANLHRFEASISLSQISEKVKSIWVPLIDKLTLDPVGKLKISAQKVFLHGTSDNGTHIVPSLFPQVMYEKSPVDLARQTAETNEKYRKRPALFGDPNHRCCVDMIVNEESTEDVKLEGFFKYGVTTASAGYFVEIFVQDGDTYVHRGKWTSYGVAETTKGGRVEFTVPRSAFSKRARVAMVMLGDLTYARGNVWVLKRGTKAVVFDLDGTVSTHDLELIKTLIGEPLKIHYDGEERNGARVCVNYWWANGYIPVYLSGRAGSYYELTLRWLENHNFPPGLIGHTLDSIPTLPIYKVLGSDRLGVGTFKLSYLGNLRDKYGLEFFAAYGNTSTDSRVYAKLGLPNNRIFMLSGGGIGLKHGKKDYVDIGRDYSTHSEYLDSVEISPVPIPTTFVSW